MSDQAFCIIAILLFLAAIVFARFAYSVGKQDLIAQNKKAAEKQAKFAVEMEAYQKTQKKPHMHEEPEFKPEPFVWSRLLLLHIATTFGFLIAFSAFTLNF